MRLEDPEVQAASWAPRRLARPTGPVPQVAWAARVPLAAARGSGPRGPSPLVHPARGRAEARAGPRTRRTGRTQRGARAASTTRRTGSAGTWAAARSARSRGAGPNEPAAAQAPRAQVVDRAGPWEGREIGAVPTIWVAPGARTDRRARTDRETRTDRRARTGREARTARRARPVVRMVRFATAGRTARSLTAGRTTRARPGGQMADGPGTGSRTSRRPGQNSRCRIAGSIPSGPRSAGGRGACQPREQNRRRKLR